VIFTDRAQAGERLGEALRGRLGSSNAVVLAIPRGGVIVAEAAAAAMGVPLDVVVPRKIGAPGNPELAIGAIAPGIRVLDRRMVVGLGVSDAYLDREIAAQEVEIDRRQRAYRQGRPPQPVEGRVAIVVDDGVATGSTAIAALRWARQQGADRVVLAVPVAPPQSLDRLRAEADDVVVLETPSPFFAVGEWYRDFDQTSDRQVVDALARSAGTHA
jgi:putative phosphoribosyl transferase